MKDIYLHLLTFALKKLTDGTLVNLAKELVTNMMSEDIPKEQKHDKVVTELKIFGADVGNTLLDIIVKVMVVVVKSKIGVPDEK